MLEDNPFAKFAGHPAANPFAGYLAVGDPDPTYQTKGPMAQAQLQVEQAKALTAALRDQADLERAQADAKKAQDDANTKPLDPGAIDMLAHQYILTGAMPAMGMGKAASGDRHAIINRVSDVVGSRSGESLAVGIARYKNGVKALGNLETQGASIRTNEGTANANAEQYLNSIRRVYPENSWAVGNMARATERHFFNDPDYATYQNARNTFLTEYAKVVAGSPTGSGVLSDSARKEQMDILSNTTSPKAAEAAVGQMRLDMRNRTQSYQSNIERGYKNLEAGQSISTGANGDLLDERGNIIPAKQQGAAPGNLPGAPGPGGNIGGGSPPAGGSPPLSGAGGAGGPSGQSGSGAGPMTLATGSTKAVDTSQVNAVLDGMIRSGASDAQISAAIQPLGFGAVDPRQTARARAFLAKNPNYTGSFGSAQATVPTTTWDRFKSNPAVQGAATAALGAGDAALLGTSDEIGGAAKSLFTGRPVQEEIAGLNADKQAAFANNPMAALFGQTAGSMAGMAAMGGGLAAMGGRLAIPRLASPLLGDVAYGAASGAGQDNDNRLFGTIAGGVGGLTGNLLGQGVGKVVGAAARTAPGLAVTNSATAMASRFAPRMFAGRMPIAAVAPLTSAERSTAGLIDKAGGLPTIMGQLTEANNLGVPMSLADTHPEFRELAGAAVRRSPGASSYAENNLIPRSQGQYDRFTSAVDNNFGPTINIPQRSADLTAQARTAAGPLYDKAYASPVTSTPELDSTLNTPNLVSKHSVALVRLPPMNGGRPANSASPRMPTAIRSSTPQPGGAIANHLAARQELDAAQDAYRQARATPGVSMDVATMRVNKARQGMRDAQAALDGSPDPSLPLNTPGYTTQTLDYVKRGMDDVLEQQRNPLTGRLNLDEAGRAQNAVKKRFSERSRSDQSSLCGRS